MDAQRWLQVGAVFDRVIEAPLAERAELVDRLCGDDAQLRAEVMQLLAADDRGAQFDRRIEAARSVAATQIAGQSDAEPVPVGERIGPWRVLRELGRGGMGVVLLAERADGQFEQRAALKLARRGAAGDEVLDLFRRERQILAHLEHPHIARLIDGGIDAGGRPYFAMEYVDGLPLLRYCDEASLAFAPRIELFLQLCAAVQFAHSRLVIHSDIKPSNILVTGNGSGKLLDFGIARLLGDAGADAFDARRPPLTRAYAAPEQLRGEPVGTAADIHALGAVLCELASGRRPFVTGDDALEPAADQAIAARPPRMAGEFAAAIPRRFRTDFARIVGTALQHDPRRRYATVEALADDLRRLLQGQPISVMRDNTWYRARRFVTRHRFGVAASIAGLLALGAAALIAAGQAREKTREAEVSRQVTEFVVGLFRSADPATASGPAVTARDLLERGTEGLQSDTRFDTSVRADLLQTLAKTYTGLGLYDRALQLAQQALALRRVRPAAADLGVASSLVQLGSILRLKADYAQAEPLLRDGLRTRRGLLPADDPQVIESVDELGALLRARGRFKDADAAFGEAYRSAERRFGADAVETAQYIDDYAANRDDMGNRAEALALYRRALAIREQRLGANSAEVATSLLDLGVHLDESGAYAEALPLLERALAIRTAIFGPGHLLVGAAQVALAGLYEDLSRFDDAERLAGQALAIYRSKLPEDHPKISEGLNMLGTIKAERRDYAAAVPLMRDVVERFRRTLGPEHPDTLTAENNLSYALGHAGRLAEAERLQREVLAQTRSDNGTGTEVLNSQNLAGTLEQEGRFAEAVELDRRALEIQKRREGATSANVAVALRTLAAAEEMNADGADAERDFRAALAMGRALAAKQGIATYEWEIPLADLLVGTQRCSEAVPLLDSAMAQLDAAKAPPDPVWQPVARLLLGACLAGGARRSEGAAMQARARAALDALPGIGMDLYPTSRKLFGQSDSASVVRTARNGCRGGAGCVTSSSRISPSGPANVPRNGRRPW